MPHVGRIDIYPIKALDPVRLSEATVLASGALAFDRRWALFDGRDKPINGKNRVEVHRIRAQFDLDRLEATLDGRTFSLERDHYDIGFQLVSVRNYARYSPPVFERSPEQRHDWEIMLELGSRLQLPDTRAGKLAGRAVRAIGRRVGPRGVLDLGLRLGPYPLTLAELEKNPHGVDLGPLEPRLPAYLYTRDHRIDLARGHIVGGDLVVVVARRPAAIDGSRRTRRRSRSLSPPQMPNFSPISMA